MWDFGEGSREAKTRWHLMSRNRDSFAHAKSPRCSCSCFKAHCDLLYNPCPLPLLFQCHICLPCTECPSKNPGLISCAPVSIYTTPPGIKKDQSVNATCSLLIVQTHHYSIHYALKTISAPTPRFTISMLFPFSCRNICLTPSLVYFRVFTDMTLSPLLSLSSS